MIAEVVINRSAKKLNRTFLNFVWLKILKPNI